MDVSGECSSIKKPGLLLFGLSTDLQYSAIPSSGLLDRVLLSYREPSQYPRLDCKETGLSGQLT